MVPMAMPRYVSFKRKQSGSLTFFWTCPTAFRKAGAPYTSVTLGSDLPQGELNAAAEVWNERLDGWRMERKPLDPPTELSKYGTVEWLVNAYLRHECFLEKVGEFSRPDYKRVLDRVCDEQIERDSIKQKVRVGDLKIGNVGVSTAQKLYRAFSDVGAARTSEKVVGYCKAMWKRMRPHHPELFRTDTPNPWEGVTLKRRKKAIKGHVDREAVYAFADGALEKGRGELAAAAVLAFEWLMRPSSIGAGYAPWGGYRGSDHPDKIRVKHRKTDELAFHPLEYIENGELVMMYEQAEAVLKKVPKYGTSIVAKKNGQLFGDGTFLAHEVRELADELRKDGKLLAPAFSLDMCRHGGMTELEEMELTEGEGRALSKHRTSAAYRGYAKDTEKRVLIATKKRMGISERPEKAKEINDSKPAKNG